MDYAKLFKDVLVEESQAISDVSDNLDKEIIEKLVDLFTENSGKIITTGMGKSGIIARKISATMNSIGKVSLFLHPSEALHGDFGIAQSDDVALIISHSGETEEITKIIPYLQMREVDIVAITSKKQSTLGINSNICIEYKIKKEADLHNLVPTTSTTVALAIGDAIAVMLMALRNITPNKFALNHPSGSLGKKLTLTVDNLMYKGLDNPCISPEEDWIEVINEMNKNNIGAVNVVDDSGHLIGIITDGDIRRLLKSFEPDNIKTLKSKEIMTRTPLAVHKEILAFDVLEIVKKSGKKISILPVIDKDNICLGIIKLADIHRELGVN